MGMGGIFIGMMIAFGAWAVQENDLNFEEAILGTIFGFFIGGLLVLCGFGAEYSMTGNEMIAMFNSIGWLVFFCGFVSGMMISCIPFIKRILGYD